MDDEIRQDLEHLVRIEVGRVPRILIVDDDYLVRQALAENIVRKSNRSYHVQTAEDGPPALEMLQQNRFDIVVSDVSMPRMDGLELLERIKITYPDTEVIMLTGYGTMDVGVKATKIGAFGCVAKSDDISVLLDNISLALQHRYERLKAILGLREVPRAELPLPQYGVSTLSRLVRSEWVQNIFRKTLSHLYYLLGVYQLDAQNKSEASLAFEESVRVASNRDSLIKLARLITPTQSQESDRVYARLIGDRPLPVGDETFRVIAADIHARVIGNRVRYNRIREVLSLPSSYPDSIGFDESADLPTITVRVDRDVRSKIDRIFKDAKIQIDERGRYIRVIATFNGFAHDGRKATVEYVFDIKTGYTQSFTPGFREKPATMTGVREECPLCNYFLPVKNESVAVYDGVWVKAIFNLFPKYVGHIVVVEDAEHTEWQNLPIGSLIENNLVWAAASKVLKENPNVEHTVLYKNRGFFADASFESHPHSHIVGLPVPSEVLSRGVYKAGEIIYSTQDFYVALPVIGEDFQVMVFPKSKANYIHEFSIEQLIQLAVIEKRISQVYRRHGITDWNLRILESEQGMLIEYLPRIKAGGGLEHGTRIYNRKYTPEQLLSKLRS